MEQKQDRPARQLPQLEPRAWPGTPGPSALVRLREPACLARDARLTHRDWKALRAIAGTLCALQTTFQSPWKLASAAMNRVQSPEMALMRPTDRLLSRRCH